MGLCGAAVPGPHGEPWRAGRRPYHEAADAFLRTYEGSGTQRTYAFLLVDHLRWLEREALTVDRVGLRDLQPASPGPLQHLDPQIPDHQPSCHPSSPGPRVARRSE
jgi:hypothetical protein